RRAPVATPLPYTTLFRSDLAFVAQHRDRQLGAGIDAAEQRLGHGDAAFLARGPALEHGIGFLDDVRPARRAAVGRAHDHRLAERGERIDELVLLADYVDLGAVAEMGASEAFAARLLGIADGEHDGVRRQRDFDRLLDELQVAVAGGELDVALRPVLAGGDEYALRGDEVRLRGDLAQPFDQADGLLGHARIATEAGDRVVRADDSNPAHACRIERERAVLVGEQAHRLARGFERQRAGFGVAGDAPGQLPVAVRILEQSCPELEGEHARAGAVDQADRQRAGGDL